MHRCCLKRKQCAFNTIDRPLGHADDACSHAASVSRLPTSLFFCLFSSSAFPSLVLSLSLLSPCWLLLQKPNGALFTVKADHFGVPIPSMLLFPLPSSRSLLLGSLVPLSCCSSRIHLSSSIPSRE